MMVFCPSNNVIYVKVKKSIPKAAKNHFSFLNDQNLFIFRDFTEPAFHFIFHTYTCCTSQYLMKLYCFSLNVFIFPCMKL